jgi:hypothetical protein
MIVYFFLVLVVIWCMLEAYLVWLVWYSNMVYLGSLVE